MADNCRRILSQIVTQAFCQLRRFNYDRSQQRVGLNLNSGPSSWRFWKVPRGLSLEETRTVSFGAHHFRLTRGGSFRAQAWMSIPPLFLALRFLPFPIARCEDQTSSPDAPSMRDKSPLCSGRQNDNCGKTSKSTISSCDSCGCGCDDPPKPKVAVGNESKFKGTGGGECFSCPTGSALTPVEWCEPADLSHGVLVRQACQITIDSVTRIMCETISAYQDYHDKYRGLLDALIRSLENSRNADGTQLELLDCQLIMMRADIDSMKNKIVELECFMASVQRLADAAAETAYLGHAEYHSIAMSERVISVQNEMKLIREVTARKERDMIELQSVVIVEAGKGLK